MSRVRFACTSLFLIAAAALVVAQTPPPRQPSGLPPGVDPRSGAMPPKLPMSALDFDRLSDEQKVVLERIKEHVLPPGSNWSDFLDYWFTPRPYVKDQIVRVDEKHAQPHVTVPWTMEIVKEEGDTVWLRGLPPEDPRSALHKMWLEIEAMETFYRYGEELRDQEQANYHFLDFEAAIVPPPFADALGFEEVVSGLPTAGRWQMNFAVADMNGDGVLDLVFPPERKGAPRPTIFLGSGDGRFTLWREAVFSSKVPWDYGGIAVADFDGDGHQDLAIAVHFKAQHLLFGDGKGRFARVINLPSPDPRVSSRALTAADFDGDGRLDLGVQAEINYDQATSSRLQTPTAWVVLNRGDQPWQLVTQGLPASLIGNSVTTVDADRDGRPDLLFGSNSSNFRTLVYLNRGEEGFVAMANQDGVLSNGYHFDVAVPRAGLREGNEVYAAFEQFRMVREQNQARTGLVRYELTPDGIPKKGRTLVFDDQRIDPYSRLATGDLNGDGRVDLVAGRQNGGLLAFLQSESGDFYLEQGEELAATGRPFWIELVDLDGDGLDDIVTCLAEREGRPGGVKVWLSRHSS